MCIHPVFTLPPLCVHRYVALYGAFGYFFRWIPPLIYLAIVQATANQQVAFMSIAVWMVIALILLCFVDLQRGHIDAGWEGHSSRMGDVVMGSTANKSLSRSANDCDAAASHSVLVSPAPDSNMREGGQSLSVVDQPSDAAVDLSALAGEPLAKSE